VAGPSRLEKLLALCGTIAGCTSAVEIAAYGRSKRDWFQTFLELPNGIPSHDTFSRTQWRLVLSSSNWSGWGSTRRPVHPKWLTSV
jgi:hypothetical protein